MEKSYSINGQIKARKVDLVLLNGELKESVRISDALKISEEAGMDLIEVSKNGKSGIPVCKLGDYGKMMYDQSKKNKSNKKNVKHIKEIRYGLNIDPHDLEIRHSKIFKFLSKKYTVKYVLELSGREKGMLSDALDIINNNLKSFEEHATWKTPKVSQGKRILISTTLTPYSVEK